MLNTEIVNMRKKTPLSSVIVKMLITMDNYFVCMHRFSTLQCKAPEIKEAIPK